MASASSAPALTFTNRYINEWISNHIGYDLRNRLYDHIQYLSFTYHGAVTVELGSEEEIRAAVQKAIATLGPAGFVLSPVDNITIDAPQTWRNIDVFLDEWQRRR